MYLRGRDATLVALRERPAEFRDPASLPAEPNHPGDGAVATDGGEEAAAAETAEPDADRGGPAFLKDIEGSAYGTDPEALVAEDVVWISSGIPFLVPLFGGLVVALTYGDVLFGILGLVGLV